MILKTIEPYHLTGIVKNLSTYERDGYVDSINGLCYYCRKKGHDSPVDAYDLIGSVFSRNSDEYFRSTTGYTEARILLSKLLVEYFTIGFTEAKYSEKSCRYSFKNTPEGVKIRRRIRYLHSGK